MYLNKSCMASASVYCTFVLCTAVSGNARRARKTFFDKPTSRFSPWLVKWAEQKWAFSFRWFLKSSCATHNALPIETHVDCQSLCFSLGHVRLKLRLGQVVREMSKRPKKGIVRWAIDIHVEFIEGKTFTFSEELHLRALESKSSKACVLA